MLKYSKKTQSYMPTNIYHTHIHTYIHTLEEKEKIDYEYLNNQLVIIIIIIIIVHIYIAHYSHCALMRFFKNPVIPY